MGYFLDRKERLGVIATLSMTLLALEIIWTRIFSAEFFYNFAFLILSFAIMGLGIGGLLVRFLKFSHETISVSIMLILVGFTALLGPIIAFQLPFQFAHLFSDWGMLGLFLLIVVLLELPFLFGGAIIALVFRNNHQDIETIYMADLVGAGLGILVSLFAMNMIGTPNAVVALALPVFIAALIVARRYFKVIPASLIIGICALFPFSEVLIKKERKERMPVIYTHWDAMSKIKIFADENYPDYRGINIDNAANSPVYGFDGDWASRAEDPYEFGIDVGYLIRKFDEPTFMSLGAGGGVDVLQALQYGALEVHAVEVNPHINFLMTEGLLAEFSGNIYQDARVKVVTEDARSYVRRFENKFDVIYSLSSNTFAALSSGAFGLAENYLFTIEAFEDYYRALSSNGYLSMEHQFYMPRVVSEAITALRRQGVAHPERHIAIYDLPKMRRKLLLFSKAELDEATIRYAYGELTHEKVEDIRLLYPEIEMEKDPEMEPGNQSEKNTQEEDGPNLYQRIVQEGWQAVQKESPINLAPSSDDAPFTAQLGLWKNFKLEALQNVSPLLGVSGFPLSKMIVLLILCVAIVLLLPLNSLPFFMKREGLGLAGWLYYFFIGVAFMMIEVVIIQRYTLFIGPSFYTIVATLFTLLIASGLGSRYSGRFSSFWPFLLIVLWIVLELLVFKLLTSWFGGMGQMGRILVSIVFIAPVGFFMGMPFPLGTKLVGDQVDWGFAVNGMASVMGSAGALLLAFHFGFTATLVVAGLFYLLALLSLKKLESRSSS